MFRIRFSPITASPTRPMSAWLISMTPLALDAGRAALGERDDLLQARHRGVARERREERAVRPAELERLVGLRAAQQAVDEAGGEAVAAAHAVEHVELAGRRRVGLPVDPGDGAP